MWNKVQKHSALYFALGHSMMNLRNALPVWWRYELCEETEALQCMLQSVKTKHNITKYFVFKSSIVCKMVKYFLEIIVVQFQLFVWRLLVYQMRPVVEFFFLVSFDVIWYKIKLSRFKMARNAEKSWTSLQIWCYAWCHVINEILSWLVFKINLKVQAIMCACCDIIFFKIEYLYR